MTSKFLLVFVAALLFAIGCGEDESDVKLAIRWTFAAGDCASNGVETVSVEATPTSGSRKTAQAACSAGRVDLGAVENGSYAIVAKGLDAGGVEKAESSGLTVTIAGGAPSNGFEVTLQPKASNVEVSWNGCPTGVVLPYYVTLYRPPAQAGGALTDEVTSVQESCSAGSATLENVAPGDYVVEVDSRAVTPAVRGTAPVTVVAGEDAQVTLNVP